jgi:lipopolysaccharide transport system permease protein
VISDAPPPAATRISATRNTIGAAVAECWQRRDVLYFLAWRDIKVRYKQTLLGVLWAILQPLITMVVFTLVFHRMAGIESEGVPYPVFSYAGLLPWLLFQTALIQSSGSVVAEGRLISKVYFPRLLVPFSSVLAALVDFLISLAILFIMMACYGVPFMWRTLLFLPLFMLLAVFTALAMGLWFGALNVRFRDVRHTIPFLARIWMFLTPVAYPTAKLMQQLPEGWRWLYALNPMVGVVDGFRWALLGQAGVNPRWMAVSLCFALAVFAGGIWYFRRTERAFADVL